jgi:site-specific DNA-cytosine methylase
LDSRKKDSKPSPLSSPIQDVGAVLGAHWPAVPCWGEIRNHRGVPLSGHLCSWTAGRAIRLEELAGLRADWVVVENTFHCWRKWVPELRRQLWAIGYASLCFRVRAAEVGGSHDRSRAFVVAHADSEFLWQLSRWWGREGGTVARELAQSWDSRPRGLGAHDGLPNWSHRRHAIGNAVYTPAAQLIARGIYTVSSNA